MLNFWPCKKNGLIRKVRLISKFITSQPGLQIVTIHILPNILRSKDKQTMKFCQVTEYNKRNIFLQKSVPDLFLVFKKTLYEVKQVVSSLVSIYFDSP